MLTFDRLRHFLAPEGDAGGSTDTPPADARPPTPGGPDVIQNDPPAETTTEQAQPPAEPPPPADKDKKSYTQEEIDRLVQLDRENWQAKQQIQQLESKLNDLAEFKQKFDQDPYRVAREAGLDLDTFTNRELNDGQPTPQEEIKALKAELDGLKEFRTALEQQQEDQRTQQAYAGMANEVEQYVTTNADQFGAVKQIQDLNKELGGGFDLTSFVRAKVDSHKAETGKVLTPAEVSGILHQEALKQIEAFTASPTLRAIMAEALKAEQGQQQPADQGGKPPPQAQPRRPVTQSVETESEQVDLASLSHKERLERVAAKAAAGGYDPK